MPKIPPRKLQSEVYTGPITITNFQNFQWVREQLAKKASAFHCRPEIDPLGKEHTT